MGDLTRGRIYRLAPKGHKPSVPKVDLESNEGVLAALASPNLAVRYMAMAKLQDMPTGGGVDGDLEPALEQKDNPWLQARALWQSALIAKRARPIHQRRHRRSQGARIGRPLSGCCTMRASRKCFNLPTFRSTRRHVRQRLVAGGSARSPAAAARRGPGQG